MEKKATDAARRNPTPTVGYQSLFDSNGEIMTIWMRSSEALWAGIAKLNGEVMDFANARLKENLEASDSLAHCTDTEQAFDYQCDFARRATEQYLEQSGRVMRLASETAREALRPLEEGARQSLHQINGGDVK